jgi:ABC-type transport system substrate-binding protein
LAQQALSGMAQPAYSVFNPTLPGYLDTVFFPFDPDKAKQLLSDAGHSDGIKLDFIGYSDGVSPDIISVVQSQWKDVGVDAKVTILERALLYKRWQAGDFEVLEQPVARDIPEQMIFPYFTAAGFPWPNEAHYEGIKDLAAALQPEPDINKRVELYKQIQQKLAEDTPVIPTVYPKIVLGMRKGIEPFPVDIWYYPLWRMKVTS